MVGTDRLAACPPCKKHPTLSRMRASVALHDEGFAAQARQRPPWMAGSTVKGCGRSGRVSWNQYSVRRRGTGVRLNTQRAGRGDLGNREYFHGPGRLCPRSRLIVESCTAGSYNQVVTRKAFLKHGETTNVLRLLRYIPPIRTSHGRDCMDAATTSHRGARCGNVVRTRSRLARVTSTCQTHDPHWNTHQETERESAPLR